MKITNIILLLFILEVCNTWTFSQTRPNPPKINKDQKKAYESARLLLEFTKKNYVDNYSGRGKIKIDTLIVDKKEKNIHLYLNKFLAEAPLRIDLINRFDSAFLSGLPRSLKQYRIKIYSNKIELRDYIPNIYRYSKLVIDSSRMPQLKSKRPERKNPVIPVKAFQPTQGLYNSNIALWGSHGYYYESSQDRWEWQRARLFTTVEDLSPTSFVLPYLIPMLNNASAYVLTPRERDIQTNEVIIDNDSDNKQTKYPEYLKKSEPKSAFAFTDRIEGNENPFRKGTYLFGTALADDSIEWKPDFPEAGDYMVYISYGLVNNPSEVKYRVYYEGGHQDYIVNQNIGYGTWIPLGKHYFKKGIDEHSGRLVLYVNKGQSFSIDAVRFGGGMGNVARNGKTSGKPRYMEGTRYYLQYCGFPDSLVWKQFGENKDYIDNYKCMGDWVNYLIGKPFGPKKDTLPGLGIPIDCSLAFHTDAGILGGDSIVGTLGIYSTAKSKGWFADGQSRAVSRDMTDLIQSQIVNDIRVKYNKNWTRRGMWDSDYSEAYNPNVPSMLLELLSHQNSTEMKYALDPNFRFDVSRSIYKGILKFISFQYGYDYVVQPLPVDHMKIELFGKNQFKLSWQAVIDSLEPTAKAQKFIVYTRIGDSGFDQGKVVDSNELIINEIAKNKIYSFKVTALNNGGESFPSEILSAAISVNTSKPILIVNGFDRVEGSEFVESTNFKGFVRQLDQGVPNQFDICTTGDQHDFDPKSQWIDDDCPGFGASYADDEGAIFPGNTFDFPYIHGQAILKNGYSFVSMSDEAFTESLVKQDDYLMVDLLMGEEKKKADNAHSKSSTYKIFTNQFVTSLERLAESKIPVFISGSYIGKEIGTDTILTKKIGRLLGYKFSTDHAVKNGNVYFTDKNDTSLKAFEFVTKYNKHIYPAEAPDAIEAYNSKSKTIMRYAENNMGAGVFANDLNKTIALAFPFECILSDKERGNIMKMIIEKLVK